MRGPAHTRVTLCGLQAERERRRILQRLKEGRQARTTPHQPCWFTFHPEVSPLPCADLMQPLSMCFEGCRCAPNFLVALSCS